MSSPDYCFNSNLALEYEDACGTLEDSVRNASVIGNLQGVIQADIPIVDGYMNEIIAKVGAIDKKSLEILLMKETN